MEMPLIRYLGPIHAIALKKFVNKQTCTNNHMFKRGFWDKFTEFAFFKLWNRKFEKISRFENFKEWAR